MDVLDEIFSVKKPVLGMVHFLPLPGSPLYDEEGGLEKIREVAKRDALALQEAGFDGLVFSNEGDRPYLSDVDKSTVAAMSSIITDIVSNINIPYGLSVLADSEAALSVARAVESDFVRMFLSWVYVGDWGIVNPNAGKLMRYKSMIDGDMKIFANISGHTEPMGDRSIEDIARGAVKFGLADTLCLAGTTAGMAVAKEDFLNARNGAGGSPVLAGTGVNEENLEEMLSISDGAIVGTSLKVDSNTFKPVEPKKAKNFVKKVKKFRAELK